VLCASSRQDLETTAFVNPDGSVAIVVMNRTEATIPFTLRLGTQTGTTTLPARAIATYLTTQTP
jgi:glucosylceramidase